MPYHGSISLPLTGPECHLLPFLTPVVFTILFSVSDFAYSRHPMECRMSKSSPVGVCVRIIRRSKENNNHLYFQDLLVLTDTSVAFSASGIPLLHELHQLNATSTPSDRNSSIPQIKSDNISSLILSGEI